MGQSQQILPAVAAAIFNDQGEILLQKRKDVNQWCIISGHVEFGESIEAAIVREIEEETNVKANQMQSINVSDFANGVYIVKAINNKFTNSQKLVINK